MGETSKISWTHATFNPWEGCSKVSEGCRNCYAEERNARFHPRVDGSSFSERQAAVHGELGSQRGEHWGVNAPRLMRSESYWREPLKWARDAESAGERRRVFCASLADVFEDRPDLVVPRARLFRLIGDTPQLDWLLLTKRPENMVRLTAETWSQWPDNVWAGTTVESEVVKTARIQSLMSVPARVRFLSCEPLLGPLDIAAWLTRREPAKFEAFTPDAKAVYGDGPQQRVLVRHGIDWVIVGGESGPRARPFEGDSREVPCTHCPTPCEKCRQHLGAYCKTPRCTCDCHARKS